MKKLLTALSATFLSINLFAMDMEEFVEIKKNELHVNSSNDTLNILKCNQSSILLGMEEKEDDNGFVCKKSIYSVSSLQENESFSFSNFTSDTYVSSIETFVDANDFNELVRGYKDIEYGVFLEFFKHENFISISYEDKDLISMKKLETVPNEFIYSPEISQISLNISIKANTFTVSAGENSLVIFYWKN